MLPKLISITRITRLQSTYCDYPRDGVLSEYLLTLFRREPFRRMVERAARSSTGINNLSAGRLAAFSIPLPSRARQADIVKTLGQLEGCVASARHELQQGGSYAEGLQKSARRGWLVQSVSSLPALEPGLRASAANQVHFDKADSNDLSMTDDAWTALLELLDMNPPSTMSFNDLFEVIRDEYYNFWDAAVKLLSSNSRNSSTFLTLLRARLF